MRRLNRYRATSLQGETRLQYLPVIYVTATSDHAILLEGFACAHMRAFEPAMHLDLASDPDSTMGHEKHHRDAANMLIELLTVGYCEDHCTALRRTCGPAEQDP